MESMAAEKVVYLRNQIELLEEDVKYAEERLRDEVLDVDIARYYQRRVQDSRWKLHVARKELKEFLGDPNGEA